VLVGVILSGWFIRDSFNYLLFYLVPWGGVEEEDEDDESIIII